MIPIIFGVDRDMNDPPRFSDRFCEKRESDVEKLFINSLWE